MRVKVQRRDEDIIFDYFRLKDMHPFRLSILRYIAEKADGRVILYVDTNSRLKKMPEEEIEKCLKDCGLQFEIEPIGSSKRGIFGFGSFFTSSKKNKKLPEKLVVAEITADSPLDELYSGLMMNYDYALGIGPSMDLKELVLRLKNDSYGVLFNKDVMENTIYDSIVARRLRMDSPYDILNDFEIE